MNIRYIKQNSMLINADPKQYFHFFPNDPHPFISRGFTELNSRKVEQVLYITDNTNRPGLGLIVGLREGWLLSPFSAPFGGFHFRKEVMYISEIEDFLKSLKAFIVSNNYRGIIITLPSKSLNVVIRRFMSSTRPP